MQALNEGELSHGDRKWRKARQRCSTNCLKHMIHPRRLRQMFGQLAAVVSRGRGLCAYCVQQPRSGRSGRGHLCNGPRACLFHQVPVIGQDPPPAQPSPIRSAGGVRTYGAVDASLSNIRMQTSLSRGSSLFRERSSGGACSTSLNSRPLGNGALPTSDCRHGAQ